MRRGILIMFIIFAKTVFVFSLPTGILDSKDGWISGGLEYSHNPMNGRGSGGINFEALDQSRLGIGLTILVGERTVFSIDGIYYLDFASRGEGYFVIPIKLRLGLLGGNPGIGLSAGLKWFALDISGGDKTGFISFHGSGAIDWAKDTFIPFLEGGLDFDVTIKPTSSYYYYYY